MLRNSPVDEEKCFPHCHGVGVVGGCTSLCVFCYTFEVSWLNSSPTYLFYFVSYIYSIPFVILALPSPSLPSSNSDPESHSGPSSRLPTMVRAFFFYREKKLNIFFPLRLASNCALPLTSRDFQTTRVVPRYRGCTF